MWPHILHAAWSGNHGNHGNYLLTIVLNRASAQNAIALAVLGVALATEWAAYSIQSGDVTGAALAAHDAARLAVSATSFAAAARSAFAVSDAFTTIAE